MIDYAADRAAALGRAAARTGAVALESWARRILKGAWNATADELEARCLEQWPDSPERYPRVIAEAQRLQLEARTHHVNLGDGMPRAGEVGSTTVKVREILRDYLNKHRGTLARGSEDDAASWPGPADAWGDLGAQLDGLTTKGTFTTYHWPHVTAELGIPKKRGPKSAAAATGQLSRPAIIAAENGTEPHGQSELERAIPDQELANQDGREKLERAADEWKWTEQTPDMPKLGGIHDRRRHDRDPNPGRRKRDAPSAINSAENGAITHEAAPANYNPDFKLTFGAAPDSPYAGGRFESLWGSSEAHEAVHAESLERMAQEEQRAAAALAKLPLPPSPGSVSFSGARGRFRGIRSGGGRWVASFEIETDDATVVDELARLAFRALMVGVLPSAGPQA